MPALSIQDYFMRTRFQVVITLLLSLYLPVVLFTDISLTGFWTDVIFSILSCVFVLRLAFKKKTQALWLTVILRTLAIICSFTVFGLIFLNFTNPFVADLFKLRSFYFQKVEGRMFNAYFKPVGAYSGGWGNFWITESPVYIPIIEKRVYYERAVRHDFSDDYWEGEPIDNYEVVRDYIKDEVIKKGK